ncbi:SDR family oxidoreductase [Candidatus Nitronereus thalassa]|uniref:SDR family oxidoreductase n=1 Tax=Candidatus Nitronereus thalassa TaxID=3020898 RepID=A0ABU3K4A1_9BACT|nr:SDR family oxidoreductase [Candidatus Nitronereus thalassa]MDT7041211.1 SDR family oxidoreductase [Candidatus Nitronereus thalassa]
MMKQFLRQTVALFPQANSLGADLVTALKQQGYEVMCGVPPSDRPWWEQWESTVDPNAGMGHAWFVNGDFETEKSVSSLIDDMVQRSDVCGNFPVQQSWPSTENFPSLPDWPLELWERTVSQTLRQAFLIAQRVVEEFVVNQTRGKLVYVFQGEKTNIGVATYHTALYSFVRSITKEYGARGVACNAILTNSVESTMSSQDTANQPFSDPLGMEGRWLDGPGKLAVFLLSPESDFVNGNVFTVE